MQPVSNFHHLSPPFEPHLLSWIRATPLRTSTMPVGKTKSTEGTFDSASRTEAALRTPEIENLSPLSPTLRLLAFFVNEISIKFNSPYSEERRITFFFPPPLFCSSSFVYEDRARIKSVVEKFFAVVTARATRRSLLTIASRGSSPFNSALSLSPPSRGPFFAQFPAPCSTICAFSRKLLRFSSRTATCRRQHGKSTGINFSHHLLGSLSLSLSLDEAEGCLASLPVLHVAFVEDKVHVFRG